MQERETFHLPARSRRLGFAAFGHDRLACARARATASTASTMAWYPVQRQ
jgi:hypothetical protein